MKILHVCPAYFPIRGGIEVLVETALPHLRNLYSVESSVITPRHHNERPDGFTHNGASVHSVDLFTVVEQRDAARAYATIFSKVRSIISIERPDIVHIHGFSPLALAAASIARTKGIAYIAHIHGVLDATLPPHYLRLIRDADRVISASKAVEKSLETILQPESRRCVIRNGITSHQPEWPIPQEHRILSIGRLEPEKGFADAIDALALVAQRNPGIELAIVGVGGELYSLQERARLQGVSNQVQFLGALSHDDVLHEVAKSSIVVVPSRVTEGFSLVAAEAAMVGRPVVATRVGGLPETVVDGVTGIIVPPESPRDLARAIENLWQDRQNLEAIGKNASSHAITSFGISRFVEELNECYEATVQTRK